MNRTLRADDIAGISDIYGNDTFRNATGSITGRVTKNGTGVVGAHVVAFNPATGKLVGGFTPVGRRHVRHRRARAGPHVVRVEPLDDADIDELSSTRPSTSTSTSSRRSTTRLVTVPRGGTARSIELKVVPK